MSASRVFSLCVVGPCSVEELLRFTMERWGLTGDNRDGEWGYGPTEAHPGFVFGPSDESRVGSRGNPLQKGA